jgi:hypothetical protein
MNDTTIWLCASCDSRIKQPDQSKQKRNKHFFCSQQCSVDYRKADAQPLLERISELYMSGASTREVNRTLGIGTAQYHLKRLGQTRSRSNALRNSAAKRYRDVPLSNAILEIIEGNLLGDGCISRNHGNRSCVYQHSTKYRDHLIWLKKLFEQEGIQTNKIYVRPPYVGLKGKAFFGESYSFRTEFLPAFRVLRDRWYAPVKIVPENLVLTPTTLLHWYLGDGNLSQAGKSFLRLKFSSQGFTRTDNELLIGKLLEVGLEATLRKEWNGSGCIIGLRSSSVRRFFDLIGDCPTSLYESYGHKWPVSKGGRTEGRF